MKKVLISSQVQTLEEEVDVWIPAVPKSPRKPVTPVYDARYLALRKLRGHTNESPKTLREGKPPSLQLININEVLGGAPAVCPATCPALKVHCGVQRPAGRRKSEVRLQLRTRQLSQGTFPKTRKEHARTTSQHVGTPTSKPSLRLIHSSKTALIGFTHYPSDYSPQFAQRPSTTDFLKKRFRRAVPR